VSASTFTPTTSTTTPTLVYSVPVKSRTLISVVDVVHYKSASEYSLLEATTSSALALPSSSPSGECLSDSPYEGDITYYTTGLRACGSTSNGDTKKVVALPYGLIGPESNGNLYCGKTITITCIATSRTTTAIVVNKCIGCNSFSINLSNVAFLDLNDLVVGRTKAT
jgi:hypothetical protein